MLNLVKIILLNLETPVDIILNIIIEYKVFICDIYLECCDLLEEMKKIN